MIDTHDPTGIHLSYLPRQVSQLVVIKLLSSVESVRDYKLMFASLESRIEVTRQVVGRVQLVLTHLIETKFMRIVHLYIKFTSFNRLVNKNESKRLLLTK